MLKFEKKVRRRKVNGNLVCLSVLCWTCHWKQKLHNLCNFLCPWVESSRSQLRVRDERSVEKLLRCSSLFFQERKMRESSASRCLYTRCEAVCLLILHFSQFIKTMKCYLRAELGRPLLDSTFVLASSYF